MCKRSVLRILLLILFAASAAGDANAAVKKKRTVKAAHQVHALVHTVPLPRPRPLFVKDEPRTCLARIIHTEARNQSMLGQLLVGYTAKRRAELNRKGDFGGRELCAVAHHKRTVRGVLTRQYDGVSDETTWVPKDPAAYQRSLAIADRVLAGYRPSGPWVDAVYYVNPQEAGDRGWCWFATKLVAVGWMSDHLFFREPHSEEDREFLKGLAVPECPNKKIAAK